MFSLIKLAADRSMRHVDADGHLHVELCNISKANVCPYYGREIPDWEALGLDPFRVYKLYRDPAELAAAADTFSNKPLLMHHQPGTAEEPAKELWVGTVGAARFNAPYLQAPLAVWTQDAIEAIDSEEQRELSPGYRYRADMTPGRTPEGVAFDGSMRDIKGNHVALVAEGRTGPDVYVADESLEFSTMKFAKVLAAFASMFPTLKQEQFTALDAALAEDLKKHREEEEELELSEDEMGAALDAYAKSCGKAMDSLTDEDKKAAYKRAAADKKAHGQPHAATEGRQPSAAGKSGAMDEAAVVERVTAAVAEATKDTVKKADADQLAQDAATAARSEVHALYGARKAVESIVGVVALDSAEAVYRFALDHLKVEHKDVPAPALAALFDASAKAPAAQIAQDTALFDPSILGLSHIRKG